MYYKALENILNVDYFVFYCYFNNLLHVIMLSKTYFSSRLPYAMGTMNSLKSIGLDGNPMKGIRRDIIAVSLKIFVKKN